MFSGDYRRSGLDLVLSKDGHEFVARDYFRGENRAALASSDGANLSGKTVEALAGQVDYAQAGGAIVPAKIIGQVTKLTGSATAVRNGVSISLNVGDNVHKGDVVQSGSDSSLGITFIDGTVFGLSSNARMVLNEMIYNPSGSNNASLLTLVQGTISFVAGATAKNGDMKVDTPTATMGIRGTAVLVEIDFDVPQSGGAPPVSFRILVEPNGTSGEYVLLDKLTLLPIATVNQPGSQTIVNGQGVVTFIASAQIPANAQQLINEIFSLKFTDANPKFIGIPPLDSITPQSFLAKLPDGTPIDQLPIIRIALVFEPLTPPPPSGGNNRFHLNIPPDLFASSNKFTERPHDAKGLLLAAVQDPDPVMIFEHKLLYKMKGPVPEGHYTVPIGKAEVRRGGRDVTVVATSIMVHKAMDAAKELEAEGIDAEIIDLRTIRPIDRETVIESVKKTSRLICVYEAVKTLGIGAEISAMIAESEAFDYLDAPIIRLGGADSPIPYNPDLEKAAVPQVHDIISGVRALVQGRR